MSENCTPTRPLGVAHLIFGLVFTGIAAIWFIGEANDTEVPDMAIAFPAVLIGAGVIGLVATLVNHSRAKAGAAQRQPVEPVETQTSDVEPVGTPASSVEPVETPTEEDPS